MRFFFYGSLLDNDVTALVIGRRPAAAIVGAGQSLGVLAPQGQGRELSGRGAGPKGRGGRGPSWVA